jgi:hypothetical protein
MRLNQEFTTASSMTKPRWDITNYILIEVCLGAQPREARVRWENNNITSLVIQNVANHIKLQTKNNIYHEIEYYSK